MSDTPHAEPVSQSIYQAIGGEETVAKLVDRFYHLMDSEPAFAPVREMHPPALDGSRQKLFFYLSGWFGGPNLYVEKIGQPLMRRRHMNFAIDSSARDLWLQCMAQAMQDVGISPEHQLKLGAQFYKLADFMRNQGE